MGSVPVMKGVLVSLVLVLVLGAVFWYALTRGSSRGDVPDTPVPLQFPTVTSTEADREAQRQRAIEAKDPALLPVCTEEDLTNRADPVPAKSMEPWDHLDQLGCRLPPPRPDEMELGPRSGPSPPQNRPSRPVPLRSGVEFLVGLDAFSLIAC